MAATPLDAALSTADALQAELDRLGCPAIVHLPGHHIPEHTIELCDDAGEFLTLLPDTVSVDTTILAYGLYQLGLRQGLRRGEERAWGRLRQMIGAASVSDVCP